jgi:putative chitinase
MSGTNKLLNKDTIKEMISILFPTTTKEYIEIITNIILDKAPLYKIDSHLSLSLFLSQIREEIGGELKSKKENLNYDSKGLIKTFAYYRKNIAEADADGRSPNQEAKKEEIANKVYANRLGNGDYLSGDGLKYIGAGCIQVTGKTNFKNVQIRIDRYDKASSINILERNDIENIEGGLISAFAFWIWKDINLVCTDMSDETVDKVTSIVNKHTHSYESRRNHFQKIKHLCESVTDAV